MDLDTIDDLAERRVLSNEPVPRPYTLRAQFTIGIEWLRRITENKANAATLAHQGIWVSCIVGGAQGVGKTSLIQKYVTGQFWPDYVPTNGYDERRLKFQFDDIPFDMYAIDLAGTVEELQDLQTQQNCHVSLLVFDMTNKASLTDLNIWSHAAIDFFQDLSPHVEPYFFLVGTQKDRVHITDLREIEADAIQKAQELGAEYWSVSSKTNDQSVRNLFTRVALVSLQRSVVEILDPSQEDPGRQRPRRQRPLRRTQYLQ